LLLLTWSATLLAAAAAAELAAPSAGAGARWTGWRRSSRSLRFRGIGRDGQGRFLGRRRRLSGSRHLERPIRAGFLIPDRHLPLQRPEAEHLDLDFPNAGGEVERVTAVLVGVSHHMRAALAGGHGGSWNELVGGPDGAAVPARAEHGGDEQQYTKQKAH
jgi:hypothetical protein